MRKELKVFENPFVNEGKALTNIFLAHFEVKMSYCNHFDVSPFDCCLAHYSSIEENAIR